MKIILAAPVHPRLPHKLPLPVWQPHNFWRRALLSLGHRVKIFRLTDSPHLKLIKTWQLKQLINSWQPDEIFFSAGKDAVYPLKDTVFLSGVPFSILSHNEQQIGLSAKLIVTNDPTHAQDWLNHGAHRTVCLPISAIDPQLHRPTAPIKKYQADVVFIGGLLLERQQLFLKLLKAGINLKLFGILSENFLSPKLKKIYFGPAWGKTVSQIYSSAKIILNPLPAHMPIGGNLRTFEIPGCGAFQLASRTHPNWFTNGKNIVIYQNPTDLIKKITYYLAHDSARRRIAHAGYLRTHKDHTYLKRFHQLLKLLHASN